MRRKRFWLRCETWPTVTKPLGDVGFGACVQDVAEPGGSAAGPMSASRRRNHHDIGPFAPSEAFACSQVSDALDESSQFRQSGVVVDRRVLLHRAAAASATDGDCRLGLVQCHCRTSHRLVRIGALAPDGCPGRANRAPRAEPPSLGPGGPRRRGCATMPPLPRCRGSSTRSPDSPRAARRERLSVRRVRIRLFP